MYDSILAERKRFLSRLKANPVYLLHHIPNFIFIVWRWGLNRLWSKVAPAHTAGKKRPPWLTKGSMLISPELDCKELFANIPQRKPASISTIFTEIKYYPDVISEDPEDYYLLHRWGWLLEASLKQQNHEVKKYLSDWIDQNDNVSDPSWEPYSVCERAANLLTWLSIIPLEEREEYETESYISFLAKSLAWIYQHIEYYGEKLTNNHILNNARVLIMVGVALDYQPAVEAGLDIFRKMLPILIQPGGFLRERSSHYQLIILNWLLDALYFLQGYYPEVSEDVILLKDTVGRMLAAASQLCDENGFLLACIGDISPDASPCQSARRLAILYPDFWPRIADSSSGKLDDWLWLNQEKGKVLINIPSGKMPLPYPTHGHNDITSFVWLFEKRPILIDSGRYRYTKDAISIWQKSALGHSVPLIDGLPPICESVTSGQYVPVPYGCSKIEAMLKSHNTIRITNDGFKRGGKVEKHVREITLVENELHVYDHFVGNGLADICLLWQYSYELEPCKANTLEAAGGGLRMLIDIQASIGPSRIEWLSDSIGGWFSPVYGEIKSSKVLSVSWKEYLPFETLCIFKVEKCVV